MYANSDNPHAVPWGPVATIGLAIPCGPIGPIGPKKSYGSCSSLSNNFQILEKEIPSKENPLITFIFFDDLVKRVLFQSK
ncbi:hypothetical protein [Neobacillus drentensis]|uniref:hypothetical protein n=1 Tax=Neobacillus drentensis TaxID=220684 RepID=UPI00300224BB